MNLSNLPSDVIRTIIRADLKSIDLMRVISRRWSDHCQEYLNFRNRLPVIKRFAWCPIEENGRKLTIEIPVNNRQYFGLESWLECVVEDNYNYYEHYHYMKDDDYELTDSFIYESTKNESDEKLNERLSRLYNRCSTINSLECDMWRFYIGDAFDLIRNSMRNVTVDVFTISFEENTPKEEMLKLLEFVQQNNIRNIHIVTCDIEGFNNMNTTNILCEIARAGSVISIDTLYWEFDPTLFPAFRELWDDVAQLINNQNGITAVLNDNFTIDECPLWISVNAE